MLHVATKGVRRNAGVGMISEKIGSVPFITFYSFKGGVGRSMALINVACMLAGRGRRVLAIDLDLEAPGISYLLQQEKGSETVGFVDLIFDLLVEKQNSPIADPNRPTAFLSYTTEMPIPVSVLQNPKGKLTIMPAGRLDSDYEKKLQKIDLRALYGAGKGQPILKHLRNLIAHSGLFDYVLIDSRTGFSDEASICIRDLGNCLVVLLGLNRQNVEGTARFLDSLKSVPLSPEKVTFVASPIPLGEDELRANRIAVAESTLGKSWGHPVNLSLQIPYHPRLALDEQPHIFKWTEGTLYEAYRRLEERVREFTADTAEDWAQRVRETFASGTIPEALDAVQNLKRLDARYAGFLLWNVCSDNTDRPELTPFFELLVEIDRDAENVCLLGRHLAQSGDYAKAEAAYRLALQIGNNDIETILEVANFFADIKNNAESENLFQRALNIEPESIEVLGNYAAFLSHNLNDDDRAENLLRKAVELEPQNAAVKGNLGVFLEEQRENLDEAEVFLRDAVELDPENSQLTYNLADFLWKKRQDFAEAQRYFRRTIELDPKNSFAVGRFADFLAVHGKDPERAEELFRRSLELDPENASVVRNFAIFLSDNERLDEAEKCYRQALELNPSDWSICSSFAIFLMRAQRNYDEAEALFRRTLDINPDVDPGVIGLFATFMWQERGKLDEAEKLFLRVLDRDAENATFTYAFASFLWSERNKLDDAEKMLVRALEIAPNDANYLRSYGVFLLKERKDSKRAEDVFGRALKEEPNDVLLTSLLATLASKRNDFEKAEKLFLRAIEIEPQNPDGLRNFADFLVRQKRDNDAESYYLSALSIKSEDPATLRGLAILEWQQKKRPKIAEQYFQRALKAEPNDSHTLGAFGTFLWRVQHRNEEAAKLFHRSLEIDSKNANLTGLFASFLWQVWGNPREAEKQFKRALELDPGDVQNISGYAAFLWLDRRNYAESEQQYRQVLSLYTSNASESSKIAETTASFAQLLIVLQRRKEADYCLEESWNGLSGADTQTAAEILFCVGLLSCEAGVDDSLALGKLRSLLEKGYERSYWSLKQVCDACTLNQAQRSFYEALASAVLHEGEVTSLDNFLEWQAVTPRDDGDLFPCRPTPS